jgi:DNA helicase-2/ATP-dependent DNA helicase PcrA
MDRNFKAAYRQLNEQQKAAVDTIDGPLMVVAGPGTGKTQLLSLRVANIIRQTDISPSNVLCLTFTDNAARNMRERLQTIIGQPAYHVAIHTFHSFGNEIINQFPDFFIENKLRQQIDELGQYELLQEIFQDLPHSNPLSVKIGDEFVHLKDTLAIIGWLKQNALLPHDLHAILGANHKFMETLAEDLAETFADIPSPKYMTKYIKLLKKVGANIGIPHLTGFPDYAAECAAELKSAIEATGSGSRFAPKITAWRNAWCLKDAHGRQVFKDAGQAYRKMHALASLYETLRERMAERGLYDFNDMIIEVVQALETNNELRFSLQERYQYVLVDEFQDTNKAQLRMLKALGDNPVNEERPNIMAVGDDDQAIFSFQGAEASNMVAFTKLFREPALISLKENYRSTPEILGASFAVAEQITDRLTDVLQGTHKSLSAVAVHKSKLLKRQLFASELAQYDWIAEEIQRLIKKGMAPESIAVIAPQHRYLERLMPYLGNRRLPVAYERRENILESPVIIQLLSMGKLVTAIAENRHHEIDELISQVLSYEFWGIPPEVLTEISLECYNRHKHWLAVLSKHKNKQVQSVTAWFNELAKRAKTEPLEYMLDQILGSEGEGIDSQYDDLLLSGRRKAGFKSPMRGFYFNNEHYEQATDAYLTLLGQLSTLRQRLRRWKPNQALYIADLVEFARLHQLARLKIVDTNPHTQTTKAVQVMTAYKAKGLEFDAVFVINAQDEVWGTTARKRSLSISLPNNLPIAPASDGDNDRLRLLFVSLTRARHSLYITGYTHNLDNKLSPGLGYLGEEDSLTHPAFKPQIIANSTSSEAERILHTDWAYRFRHVIADKPTLFEPVLKQYKLSVTHLNNFIDVVDGGPKHFLMHNLLRFPEAPTPSAAYGNAVHQTLQQAHALLRKSGKLPQILELQDYFADALARQHLRSSDHKKLDKRGRENLALYLKKRGKDISSADLVERGFNNDGVVVDGAELSGNIDKLHFLNPGQVSVVDYKTGKPALSWKGKDEFERVKLHKYRHQLLFYKLLVEGSASFRGKLTAVRGELEFIEPVNQGGLVDNLELSFDREEIAEFTKLIKAVWQHVMKLDFPDIDKYPKSFKGMLDFEADLKEGTI